MNEARCSVRIARGRVDEPNTPVRIIIGVNGSPGSEAAVKAAGSRTWPADSEIMLVVVDDPLFADSWGKLIPPLAKIIEEDKQEEKTWAKKIATRSVGLLGQSSVRVTHMLREGDPKSELPRVAEEWSADCIFVGSTGFSNRFERFVLGSVSAAVAARALCSVEVVRWQASEKEYQNDQAVKR